MKADKQQTIVLFFEHQPFNFFMTVVGIVILIVAAEGDITANRSLGESFVAQSQICRRNDASLLRQTNAQACMVILQVSQPQNNIVRLNDVITLKAFRQKTLCGIDALFDNFAVAQ